MTADIMDLLFDPAFLATLAAAIFAFATIVTLGLPYAERDGLGQRLKNVAQRREELRARHHAARGARAYDDEIDCIAGFENACGHRRMVHGN